MIIYNITAVVEPSQLNSWQAFAPSFLERLMNSNFFTTVKYCKIYAPSNEAPSFSIQCTTSSQERLLSFLEAHAKGFDQMVADAFGDQVLLFKTTLEEIQHLSSS